MIGYLCSTKYEEHLFGIDSSKELQAQSHRLVTDCARHATTWPWMNGTAADTSLPTKFCPLIGVDEEPTKYEPSQRMSDFSPRI